MFVLAIGFFVTNFSAMVALSFEFALPLFLTVSTIVMIVLVVSATISTL